MQSAGDFGFANAGTLELSDRVSVDRRGYGPAQALAILGGMGQAGADALAENLPFEFRKNGQQASHGATGGRGQIQRLGQRNKTDSQMLQFLEGREQVGH